MFVLDHKLYYLTVIITALYSAEGSAPVINKEWKVEKKWIEDWISWPQLIEGFFTQLYKGITFTI